GMMVGSLRLQTDRDDESHRFDEILELEGTGQRVVGVLPVGMVIEEGRHVRWVEECHGPMMPRSTRLGRGPVVVSRRAPVPLGCPVSFYPGLDMGIRNDQGIVLRGYPFGEADRIVVLLSPNHGKLRTVAKGVGRTKSRSGGRLEPFTHVDLVLYEGRNLDTITQVSINEGFPSLRSDLSRVVAAGIMVEAADAVA